MTDHIDSKLRPYLWSRSEHLAEVADNLWVVSEEIHDRQNLKGDPNRCGRTHVKSVEYNIWRLLFDPQNRVTLVEGNKREFGPYGLFLLSAAACCHDFDKADKLPEGLEHGLRSAIIVQKSRDFFGLNENQIEDISSVISIHGIDDAAEFRNRLRDLSTQKESEHGTFNLQRLALLLKAADILHLDRSRISLAMENVIDLNQLEQRARQKYLFRSCTRGWGIRGTTIHIESTVQGSAQRPRRIVQESFNWIKQNEWPTVREHLQLCGFAYELDLDLSEMRDGRPVPLSTRSKQQVKNLHVRAKRNISAPQAKELLYTALEQDSEYPLCRNGYTSHATGVVVALICGHIMFDALENFGRTFITDVGEFSLESECILSKLCEHVIRFSNTRVLLTRISDESQPSGTLDNYLKAALRTLPAGIDFFEAVRDFQIAFDEHLEDMRERVTSNILLIEPMEHTEQRHASESSGWLEKADPGVRDWFVQKKHGFVQLSTGLKTAFETLRYIRSSAQEDWNKDAIHIRTQEKGIHSPSTCN